MTDSLWRFIGVRVMMNNQINFINLKGLDLMWDNARVVAIIPETKNEEELEQPLIWDVIGAHGMPDDLGFGGFFPANVH